LLKQYVQQFFPNYLTAKNAKVGVAYFYILIQSNSLTSSEFINLFCRSKQLKHQKFKNLSSMGMFQWMIAGIADNCTLRLQKAFKLW